MEPKRVKEKLTTRQTPEKSQREIHVIEEQTSQRGNNGERQTHRLEHLALSVKKH